MSTIKTGTTLTTAYQVVGDTTGALVIQTGATPTTAMTIDSSQNLGVGATPAAWQAGAAIQMQDNVAYSRYGYVRNAYFDGSAYKYNTTGVASLYLQAAGAHQWFYAASGSAGASVSFSESMRISSSGNVGIGTNAPDYKLDVRGSLSVNYGVNGVGLLQSNGTNSDLQTVIADNLTTIKNTGSSAALAFSTNNTERMRISSAGAVGIGNIAPEGKLDVQITNVARLLIGYGLGSTNYMDADTQYFRSGNATERMRINSSGYVQIGAASSSASRLYVNRNNGGDYGNSQIEMASDTGDVVLGFHAQGATAATIRHVRGSSGVQIRNVSNTGFAQIEASAFTVGSDYRLKENIVPVEGALNRLMQLPVYRFNFKAYEETGVDYGDKTVDGFLAHEVAEVVPEAAFGEKDAINDDDTPNYQKIDQSKLVPLLAAAIQELNAKVNAQAAEIAALKGQ